MDDATARPDDGFSPGDIIAGRYRVIRLLGRGGMGEVYEVFDAEVRDRVALKTVWSRANPFLANDTRLMQELQLARRVPHPNVCRLHHIERDKRADGDVLFITMELLEGGTLASRLQRDGPYESGQALLVAQQIAAGIDAAHAQGIIHRDLKPTNIMFGAGDRVVVTDFGLARLRPSPDDATAAATGPVGTLAYMAPEVLGGARASTASDLYAFGVVLHEMVTGRLPVRAARGGEFEAPSAIVPGTARIWDRVILGCLASDPAQRVTSAAAALGLFARAPHPDPPPAPPWWRRRAALATVVTMLALLVWLGWSAAEDLLRPLPRPRFVALMAWPAAPDAAYLPMVRSALDAISTQLARAEASGTDLMVISTADVTGLGTLSTPADAARALGANLVLTAALRPQAEHALLELAVLEAATARVLRTRIVSIARAEFGRIPEEAWTSAADLLNVRVPKGRWTDQDELAAAPTEAYQAFTEAESLATQPNDQGLEAAIERYQAALDAHPRFAYAYARLSLAYSRTFNRFKDRAVLSLAERNADLAIRYNVASINAVLARARVQLYSGRPAEALTALQGALGADPGNPQLLIAQATAFRFLTRPADEEAVYRELIRNRPNFWPAYNELGLVLFRQGQYARAADVFAEGAAVAPKVARLLTNLGAMQLSSKQTEAAEATFRRSLELSPTEAAYTNLGTIAFGAGRYRDALEFYQRAQDLNPRNDVIWRNIGDCYTMLGDQPSEQASYQRAAELVQQSLAINSTRGTLWIQLALYRAKLGRRAEAQQALTMAAANGATDLQSEFKRAQVLMLLGDRAAALRVVLACLDRGLAPTDVELALDLKELRTEPQYLARIAKLTNPTP